MSAVEWRNEGMSVGISNGKSQYHFGGFPSLVGKHHFPTIQNSSNAIITYGVCIVRVFSPFKVLKVLKVSKTKWDGEQIPIKDGKSSQYRC